MDIVEKINAVLNEENEIKYRAPEEFKIGDKVKITRGVHTGIGEVQEFKSGRYLVTVGEKELWYHPSILLKVVEEDAVNFSDKTKWEEIAKSKGAKKFNKDSKTGEVIAVDDKDNFLGAWNERTRKGMM